MEVLLIGERSGSGNESPPLLDGIVLSLKELGSAPELEPPVQ